MADTSECSNSAAPIAKSNRLSGASCMVGELRYQCPSSMAARVTPSTRPDETAPSGLKIVAEPVVGGKLTSAAAKALVATSHNMTTPTRLASYSQQAEPKKLNI